MIMYIYNLIGSINNVLGLIGEFGQTVGYKVNNQKLRAFLYTNNGISEVEIRKQSHLL